jgi:non-heme chloroperoxidase
LSRRRSRPLSPEGCYPAHDARVTARFQRVRSGLTVRVVECGPPNGRSVILLPGWGVSAFTYRYQLPALGAAGYRATAVDLKGHGFSDKPLGRGEYTFEAMARHVEEVLEAVASGPAVVVGQSMAGALAIHLTTSGRHIVAAQILIGPVGLGVIPFIRAAVLLTPRVVDPVAPHLARRSVVRAGLRLAYGDPGRITEDTVDEYWAPAQFPEFARALRALVHDFRWAPLPHSTLAMLDDRTLIVLGARDRLVRGSERRALRLAGPTVVVVEDAGHAANEEQPDAVNAALVAFLARLAV